MVPLITFDWFEFSHVPSVGETLTAPTNILPTEIEPLIFQVSGFNQAALGQVVDINGQNYTLTAHQTIIGSVTADAGPASIGTFLLHFSDGMGGTLLLANLGPSLDEWSNLSEIEFTTVGAAIFSGSVSLQSASFDQDTTVACFAPGTQIRTPAGALPVERLAIGDNIILQGDVIAPIKWIGRQRVRLTGHIPERLEPVRIAPGALGEGLPNAPLTLSADHALWIDGVLVNAGALVNGTSIDFVPHTELGEAFTYYHIETVEHGILYANGAPAETFCDTISRSVFDNFPEYSALYGPETLIHELPVPRISSARLVPESLRRRFGLRNDTISAMTEV